MVSSVCYQDGLVSPDSGLGPNESDCTSESTESEISMGWRSLILSSLEHSTCKILQLPGQERYRCLLVKAVDVSGTPKEVAA